MLRSTLQPLLRLHGRYQRSQCLAAAVLGRSQRIEAVSAFASPLAAAVAAAALAAASARTAEAEAASPIQVERITLKDGRVLAYRELGDPDGVPIIALHGMSSSHLTWLPESPLWSVTSGVRLIAIDRPGYGGSTDPPACYSYAKFAYDLAQLADALNIERFAVAGHSSGGPYALAAAALLPSRVLACAAVSSDPPYSHPRCPEAVRLSDGMSVDGKGGFYGRDPVAKVSNWRAKVCAAEGGEGKKWAWKQGVVGFVTDFMLERLPWSFRIEDIALGDRLSIWYGTRDYEPMIVGAPWMQSLVPGSQLRVVQDGKHSFKSDPVHMSAILTELRDQARSQLLE